MNPIEYLEHAFMSLLTERGLLGVLPRLSRSAHAEHGDLSSSVALSLAKSSGRNPKELAEEIAQALRDLSLEQIDSISVAGPGFINLTLTPEYFSTLVSSVLEKPQTWGRNALYEGKRVMVEYTDPNPFKEFHIGHLMSNAVGESLARLVAFSGAEVKRANYQGDVGLHVAKALYGMEKLGLVEPTPKELGGAYAFGAKAYEAEDEAKQEIHRINKAVYARSDERVNALYDTGRKVSLEHFEELYRTLGTAFDFYFFESETAARGKALVEAHPELFEESEGARVFRGEAHGLHTRVFLTSEGLPTYEAKDLGLAFLKRERYPFDSSITVTASEQSGYFAVVRRALSLIDAQLGESIEHVAHGMMRLTTGKMSSRTGDVVTGESLIGELTDAALRKMEERAIPEEKAQVIAEMVAVGAIKYSVLRQGAGRDIIFDPKQALSLEGDSGPYLQYAAVRANTLLAKAKGEGLIPVAGASGEPTLLERALIHFPSAVERAVSEREPHHVATYLTELASLFNSWYASERVLGAEGAPRKLAVVAAFSATMENGLNLLGIKVPEEM